MSRRPAYTFYEFFAGGGMARLGLGERWRCVFANDFDPVKAATYRANFGADHFVEGDVFDLAAARLPGRVDLAWASSPCQDFSLAGARAGLKGGRSSAFFGFWRLIEALNAEGRAPALVAVENVTGLLTSHGGADFAALCRALAEQGYRFGVIEIDAALFVPQSRRRVVIVGVKDVRLPQLPPDTVMAGRHSRPPMNALPAVAARPRGYPPTGAHGSPALPAGDDGGLGGERLEGGSSESDPFESRAVAAARARLPDDLRRLWIGLPSPAQPARNADLALLEPDAAADWHSAEATRRLLALMDRRNRDKVEVALASGERRVGAVFRRVRGDGQRAEVRFDGLAGCLRTPRGGSSRQALLVVEGGQVRSRLVSPREAARLMGLPDTYRLPDRTNAALHVAGDGVVVPVVRWLAETVLEPLLTAAPQVMAAE